MEPYRCILPLDEAFEGLRNGILVLGNAFEAFLRGQRTPPDQLALQDAIDAAEEKRQVPEYC